MKNKMQKNYIDNCFGFPVKIGEVLMRWSFDEWIPEIDFFALESRLLYQLPFKPSRFTGAEIKFIRSSEGLTLKDFGKRIGVSHVAVKKWEAGEAGDDCGMSWPNEKLLRITLLAKQDREAQVPALLDKLSEVLPSEDTPWFFNDCGQSDKTPTRAMETGKTHAQIP